MLDGLDGLVGAMAARIVPLRHTNPRMNGTARQANSKSKARVSRMPVCLT